MISIRTWNRRENITTSEDRNEEEMGEQQRQGKKGLLFFRSARHADTVQSVTRISGFLRMHQAIDVRKHAFYQRMSDAMLALIECTISISQTGSAAADRHRQTASFPVFRKLPN
jgi:hypothetical protein